MIEFIYKGSNKNIKKAVAENIPQLNYNMLNKLLRNKDIRINGIKADNDSTVNNNDVVKIYVPDDKLKQYEIIYSDENILVVNKGVNIEVEGEGSLTEALRAEYPGVKPVHRIDRNTKGLTVFALNNISEKELVDSFKNHTVEKYYEAKIKGILREKEGTIKLYLCKNAEKSEVYVYDDKRNNSREVITQYWVIYEDGDVSTVAIRLITGATHQIRASFAHIGHPVVGDGKYGDNDFNKKKKRKYQELIAKKIIFHFNSGILSYLDGKIISI